MKKLFTTFIVTVLALSGSAQVTADFSFSDTLCVGEMAKFKANSSGVQIYYWNFGDDPNFTGWIPTQDSNYGHIFYSAIPSSLKTHLLDTQIIYGTSMKMKTTLQHQTNRIAFIQIRELTR